MLKLMRLPEVRNVVGLSKSEIYRQINFGTFPEPISIGARSVAWTEASVQEWIQSKVDASTPLRTH